MSFPENNRLYRGDCILLYRLLVTKYATKKIDCFDLKNQNFEIIYLKKSLIIIKVCQNIICVLKSTIKISGLKKSKKIFFTQKAKIDKKNIDNWIFTDFLETKTGKLGTHDDKTSKKSSIFPFLIKKTIT